MEERLAEYNQKKKMVSDLQTKRFEQNKNMGNIRTLYMDKIKPLENEISSLRKMEENELKPLLREFENISRQYFEADKETSKLELKCIDCGKSNQHRNITMKRISYPCCDECAEKICECGKKLMDSEIYKLTGKLTSTITTYRICGYDCTLLKESDRILVTDDEISKHYQPGNEAYKLAQKSFEDAAGIKSLDE